MKLQAVPAGADVQVPSRVFVHSAQLRVHAFLEKVKELRYDLTDWLVHFTRGIDEEASVTLSKILSEAALRSSRRPPVICFSEAPLVELNKLFQLYRVYPGPRFAPFGVAVRKTWLFSRGGRPVSYLDRDALRPAMQYLHVDYAPPNRDFTCQREWRICTHLLRLVPAETLVLVPTEKAASGLTYDFEVDCEYEGPDEVSVHAGIKRRWYSLALDEVGRQEVHVDSLIAKSVRNQELSETEA
jgi:hypothetical protein